MMPGPLPKQPLVPAAAGPEQKRGANIKSMLNTLRPRQNGRHFADDIFKCICLNENARISLKISLKFVPKVRINDIPALVQIMAWLRPGDKPLSEPMMGNSLTHICVTRPQWVYHSPEARMGQLAGPASVEVMCIFIRSPEERVGHMDGRMWIC